MVNFTSLTFRIPNVEEKVNGMNVLTNSPDESGNGDVTAGLANIVNENEGEFRVIKNQLGSTTESASEIMSIPSTVVIHGLPSSRSQDANLLANIHIPSMKYGSFTLDQTKLQSASNFRPVHACMPLSTS